MYFNEPSVFLRELDKGLTEQVEIEEDDSLPVIDIDEVPECGRRDGEEIDERLPKKSYLPKIDIEF